MPTAAAKQRTVLCVPCPKGPLEHDAKLDKFRHLVLTEGKWTNPTYDCEVDATPEFMTALVAKFNKYKDRVESYVPLGHTRDPLKNIGKIESVEVVTTADGKKAIEAVFDIRNPEVASKAKNKEVSGVSVFIPNDFTVSNPDGTVDKVGNYLEHVCITTVPIIGQGHLGDFEPVVALDKETGVETTYVTLAAEDDAFMDPPDAVVNGERLATHDECDYRAGTWKESCSSCLAYCYCSDHCDFVEGPIKNAGLCNYFRPKYGCMDREVLLGSGIAMLEEDVELVGKCLDSKMPYGNVTYGDTGYQKDKVKRYPLDTAAHVRAAWNYINKEKNANKYTAGQAKQIKSRIIAAWKAKIDKEGPPSAKEMDKEPTMPVELAALGKELGVELSGDDPKAMAEAIKAKLAPAAPPGDGKPDQKTSEQLAALAKEATEFKAELERNKGELALMKTENAKLAQQNALAAKERRLTTFSHRLERCEALGKITPAERDKLLFVGNDDKGEPRKMALAFDHAAPQAYGDEWDQALARREIKLEAYEEREEFSAIPKDVCSVRLARWTEPFGDAPPELGGDGKPKTAAQLAKEKEDAYTARAEKANGMKKKAKASA